MALEAPGATPLDFLIKSNRKINGNKPGSSWSHFLPISLSKVIENQQEVCLEAPGAISFRFPYQNQQKININRTWPWKLLGPFPSDFHIKTNGTSIGNCLGSSWSQFLQISLSKITENQQELALEAPEAFSFRFPCQNQQKRNRKQAWKLLGQFPLDFLIKPIRKSKGNRLGSSWGHFLQISSSKLIENEQEIGLGAPGAISLRFLHQNYYRKYAWKLLQKFPLDFFIKTDRQSIGNSLWKLLGPFPIDFHIKTTRK